MSVKLDSGPAVAKIEVGTVPPVTPGPPNNWRTALTSLISARADLVQYESKQAAVTYGKSLAWILAACGCLAIGWALILTGGISLLSESQGWPWNRIAIGAALLHLLFAIVLLRLAKPGSGSPFPITRAEFKKDRAWIENFHKSPKSSD